MELKELQSFYTLSKELNYTRTAQLLGYSQANITVQIKNLEKELQYPLFHRLGKRITLTEQGRRLIPLVAQLLEAQRRIESMETDEEGTGRIRIGVCDSLCVNRLPELICRFKREYPKVSITIEILKCYELYQKLSEDSLDLAFTIGYLKKDERICFAAECEEEIVVLCAPDFSLAGKRKLKTQDFNGIPLILAETAAYYRRNFVNALEKENITPNIMVETESIQAIKMLTQKGLGVCIMPRVAALTEIAQGSLVVLDYKCDYGIHSHIIWHRDKLLSKSQRKFMEMSCEYIEKTKEKSNAGK